MALRLLRHTLGCWVDPAEAYRALYAGESEVVWLDSGPEATAGRSYLGRASEVLHPTDETPLTALRRELERTPLPSGGEGFSLGWVGWIGYETRFETMNEPRSSRAEHPESALMCVTRAIEFDHATSQVTLLVLGEEWSPDLLEWRDAVSETLDELARHGAGGFLPPSPPNHAVAPAETLVAHWRDSDAHYLDMIRECQRAIAAGDAYLLCLTTEVSVATTPDPFETYLRLRAVSPSHHGALLRIGEVALLSSSPEQFLSVTPDGVVETRPIKGTRPRSADPVEDAALAAELLASEKERAENLMIVDLMRNDIGRVSRVGSVEVPSLLAVESYAPVHQLVSTVRGRLEAGLVGLDAVAACFPAGSMTGAPKSSAVKILDRLEGRPRGIYSGVFGYFGFDGRIDLGMVIRSIILTPEGARVGVGGGITILSDPDEELAEVKLKASALLRVLGATA